MKHAAFRRYMAAAAAATLLPLAAPAAAQEDAQSSMKVVTVEGAATSTTPAATQDARAATQGVPAATQDARAATQDVPAATQDAPAATQNVPAATQDARAATQDTPATTQDAPSSTQDAPAATQDATIATQDAITTWPAGRSAAQPYAGVPEVNLEETMGYILLYPRAKMPATHFCNVLELYLPREDVERGEGSLHLRGTDGYSLDANFTDEDTVIFRPLSTEELSGLMWGSGTCIEIRLPLSLTIGADYYVTMDEGCFTAADGKVRSLGYEKTDTWVPVVEGDFGVNALRYIAKAEQQTTLTPKTGDSVVLDLLIGGDATSAVLYSENNSVTFATTEYTESAHVSGEILSDDISYGVVFLNENGDILDVLALS